VQHAVVVRESECLAHRIDHRCDLVERERPSVVDQVGEVRPVDVLHDQERLVRIGVEVEDGDDRGVVEHRGGSRLGKSRGLVRPAPGVEGEGQALDGDPALHARVPRECHGAEPALAQLGERPVPVENE